MLKSIQNRWKSQTNNSENETSPDISNRIFGVSWIIILIQFIIIVTLLLSIFAYFLTRPVSESQDSISTRTYLNFELQTSQPNLYTFRKKLQTTQSGPQSIDIDFLEDVVPQEETISPILPRIEITTTVPKVSLEFDSSLEDKVFDNEKLRAAILSESEICSDIGKTILIRGGNAVDAAIAASFCLMAAFPHKASLGGGINLLIKDSNGNITTINGRESTPMMVDVRDFRSNPDLSRYGKKSVATPGALNGLFRAFEHFASRRISWKQLIFPTIQLCSKGFNINIDLKENLRKFNISNISIENGKLYCNSLASTLSEIAEFEDPLETFYKGEMTKRLKNELNGFLDVTDFEDFESDISPAICSNIDTDTKLCGPGPPSLFAVLSNTYLVSKNMSNLEKVNELGESSTRFANKIVDPMFHKSSLQFSIELANGTKMKPEENAKNKNIDFTEEGSTNVFIIDENNMTVSLSLSLGDLFGSQVYSSLGFFWNNKLKYFNILSDNQTLSLQPGKVPTTRISPFVVLRNNSIVTVGGGTDFLGNLHLLRDITHRNYDAAKIAPALFVPNFSSGIVFKSNKEFLQKYSITGY